VVIQRRLLLKEICYTIFLSQIEKKPQGILKVVHCLDGLLITGKDLKQVTTPVKEFNWL